MRRRRTYSASVLRRSRRHLWWRVATVVSATLLVAAAPRPARAGNVLMQIECGSPPKSQPTGHQARLVNFKPNHVEDRGYDIILPVDGEVDELWIDDQKLTLTQREVARGFVQTKELGRVFFYISETAPGYVVVLLPEQVDKLAARPAPGAGGP